MNNCFDPSMVTCGICICNPALASVPTCAVSVAPNVQVCGGGVGTSSCGMAQVTVAAAKTSILPWVIGIGLALYWLSHRR